MIVRPRTDDDLDALAAITGAVRDNDGYPDRYRGTLRDFVVSSDALGAWVAEIDGAVAGHVALHASSLPVVMDAAARDLRCDTSALGVVARLLVDPEQRRAGIGRVLLDTAANAAHERGLHPILDVVTSYDAANALYAACGWRRVDEVLMQFRDGTELQSYVWVAP